MKKKNKQKQQKDQEPAAGEEGSGTAARGSRDTPAKARRLDIREKNRALQQENTTLMAEVLHLRTRLEEEQNRRKQDLKDQEKKHRREIKNLLTQSSGSKPKARELLCAFVLSLGSLSWEGGVVFRRLGQKCS